MDSEGIFSSEAELLDEDLLGGGPGDWTSSVELKAPPFEVVMDVDVNYGGVDDQPRTFGG